MHTPEHERWYESLALGERARVPESVAREIELCGECVHRMAEWRAARTAVDAAAREQREVFAQAAELDDAPGAARAEALLAQLAHANRRRRLQRTLALAAAAVIAVAVGVWIASTPGTPREVDVLGGNGFTEMSPHGATASVERFAWRYPSPPGGWFIVSIRPSGAPTAEPILASGNLREPRWEPTREQLASLPLRFEWQVSVFEPGPKPLAASPSVSVWPP